MYGTPYAAAPYASTDTAPNLNKGSLTGVSTLSASAQVLGAGSATGVSTLAVSQAQLQAAGLLIGQSILLIGTPVTLSTGGTVRGISVLSAAGILRGGTGTVLGSALLSALGIVLGNASLNPILGNSALAGFPSYPHYTKWNPESELFSFTGAEVEESDAAFEQAGRVVFAAQRTILNNKEIWLYWFDPIVGTFVFKKIANGRNPRLLLDDPFDTTNSDVLLFYITPIEQRLVFRQQRDRYLIEYQTPMVKVPASYIDLYLQDATKGRDGRLVLLLARHIINTGRYVYERLESTLYPFRMPHEDFTSTNLILPGGVLEQIVLTVYTVGQIPLTVPNAWIAREEYTHSQSFTSGLVQQPVIPVGPHGTTDSIGAPVPYENDVDAFKGLTDSFVSGINIQVLFLHTLFDKEQFTSSNSYISGTNVQVLFDHVLFDTNDCKSSSTFQAAGSSLA